MATLTKQTIGQAGLEATYAACTAGGDKVAPGPGVFLHVKNGSAGDITVTLDDPNSTSPAAATAFNPDVAVVVTAAEERFIPVPERFRNSVDGLAAITYSGVTSLTIAALVI